MILTKEQFDVMIYFEKEEEKKYGSPEKLSKQANISQEQVSELIGQLEQKNLLRKGVITEQGWSLLEQYRVKRAIFIAAGFGSRLVPITLNTPKPLIRVKGKRIIDSLLDAVIAAGIEEIYIVRGYLSEQFDQLLYKYPMIKFIENPAYNESNNISSIVCANHLLKNAYVLEADLLLYNHDLITKYQYCSNYLGVPVQVTDDWCFFCDENKIKSVGVGGRDCYQMVGISYWTEQDGARLSEHVKKIYQDPGGKERYWDQVPLQYYSDAYDVLVRKCTLNDVTEIDTFKELKLLDKTYDV